MLTIIVYAADGVLSYRLIHIPFVSNGNDILRAIIIVNLKNDSLDID